MTLVSPASLYFGMSEQVFQKVRLFVTVPGLTFDTFSTFIFHFQHKHEIHELISLIG